MTTYITDLIDIPEHVHAGDFVLKLAEGVNRADDTLRQYVVTPRLADCFDQALALVRGALTDGTSKGEHLLELRTRWPEETTFVDTDAPEGVSQGDKRFPLWILGRKESFFGQVDEKVVLAGRLHRLERGCPAPAE